MKLSRKAVAPHNKGSQARRDIATAVAVSHPGIHGGDGDEIGGYVRFDLPRDIDGLPLVAKIRTGPRRSVEERFRPRQQKIKHQNGRKQAVEDGARSSK